MNSSNREKRTFSLGLMSNEVVPGLGLNRDKSLSSLRIKELATIYSRLGYVGAILYIDRCTDFEILKSLIKEFEGLKLQITLSYFYDEKLASDILTFKVKHLLLFEKLSDFKKNQEEILCHSEKSTALIVSRALRPGDLSDLVSSSKMGTRQFLFFPFVEDDPKYFNTGELSRWAKSYFFKFRKKSLPIYEGLDFGQINYSNDRWFSRDQIPKVENLNQHGCQVSVIIPVYNNKFYLMKTLGHLAKQTNKNFETLVIDDGSDDGLVGGVTQWASQEINSAIGLSLYSLPRRQPHEMGGDSFRAGIARNFGVLKSKGEILLFLDSDILLPSDFMESVIWAHKEADVLLPRRVQLCRGASLEKSYQDIGSEDTYRSHSGYWESFYARAHNWEKLDNGWKYISTYCLSVKKSQLLAVGSFRPVFQSYGFEDTDLGFRLYRRGCPVRFLDKKVYHLYHDVSRSEFRRKEHIRNAILAKSAKVFFRQHLNKEIIDVLGVYLVCRIFYGFDYSKYFFFLRRFYKPIVIPFEILFWDYIYTPLTKAKARLSV